MRTIVKGLSRQRSPPFAEAVMSRFYPRSDPLGPRMLESVLGVQSTGRSLYSRKCTYAFPRDGTSLLSSKALHACRRALPLTTPRHQIYGDPVIMGEIEHGKTEAWLPRRGDRILAWFAQPGKLACPKGTDLRRAVFEFEKETSDMCRQPLPISPDEPREVRELKQIVNGLREEMTAYLANGNGTLRSYWRRLMARTREEIQIYERTRRELERETDQKVWNEKNESLRILGLRTIPNPKEME